jgi:hypothetical protein
MNDETTTTTSNSFCLPVLTFDRLLEDFKKLSTEPWPVGIVIRPDVRHFFDQLENKEVSPLFAIPLYEKTNQKSKVIVFYDLTLLRSYLNDLISEGYVLLKPNIERIP